jgi:hypothetical protein
MSRFDEELDKYRAQMAEVLGDATYQDGWLVREAERLGPNIYDADASLVATSDRTELDRVAAAFIKRFEGIDADQVDQAITTVAALMSGVKRKYRAVFYYLVTVELGRIEEASQQKGA